MPRPLITIGMPAYNGATWIRDAVRSLQAQTFPDFRLLIRDNASTDDTVRICEELAAADSRIEVRRNEQNIGVFRNYDRVFDGVHTRYFKWASCNDLCAPTFLEKCIARLEADPTVVVAFPRTILFMDDPAAGTHYDDDLHVTDVRPSQRFRHVLQDIRLNNAVNGVIRTDVLRRTGLNQTFQGSDVLLLAELAFSGSICRLPEFLFYRRVHPTAASAKKDSIGLREFYRAESRDVLATPRFDQTWYAISAIFRAPMSSLERTRSALHLARRTWWARNRLWHEMTRNWRQRIPH